MYTTYSQVTTWGVNDVFILSYSTGAANEQTAYLLGCATEHTYLLEVPQSTPRY